jgi:hypothetical protein
MCSLDPRLEENLQSFADLSAPDQFQVFLCLAAETMEAYPLAVKYATAHPHRFKLVVGADASLSNPKMSQLVYALQNEPAVSKNPFIWVSESNVETCQEFMENLAMTWKEANAVDRKPTLVNAPIVAVYGTGLGARMERMTLSSELNPNSEIALLMGTPGVIGKTQFFHRDDMEKLGGLQQWGNNLCEDQLMGEAFYKAGRLAWCSFATRNVIGELSVSTYRSRHDRWAMMRCNAHPSFMAEPLISFMVPVSAWLLGLLSTQWIVAFTVFRCVLDWVNHVMMTSSLMEVHVLDMLVVPLKEVLLFYSWCRALLVSNIEWRGSLYRLGWKTVAVQIKDDKSLPV